MGRFYRRFWCLCLDCECGEYEVRAHSWLKAGGWIHLFLHVIECTAYGLVLFLEDYLRIYLSTGNIVERG